MRELTLVHPRLLETLGAYFPQTGTVQARAEGEDAAGQPNGAFADVAGLGDLPCRVMPSSLRGQEVKGRDQTYAITTHTILLQGYYAGIAPTMRFVVGVQAYDILLVEADAHSSLTQLQARIVT
jgi:hypothetical protein